MKKSLILILVVVFVFLILIYFNGFYSKKEIHKVCLVKSGECFNVQIADDEAEREKGLMFIEQIDDDYGMLFVFDKSGKYNFWMKDTLIPLDIIWIDNNKEIVYVSEDTLPCIESLLGECQVYSPNFDSLYVLEIKGGMADKLGIYQGDKVEMR